MSFPSTRACVRFFALVMGIAAVGFFVAGSPITAESVTLLLESECSMLLGGDGCNSGDARCACNTSACGGTSGCTVTTCSNVGGTCTWMTTDSQDVCGTPSSDYPNGCDSATNVWGCATVWSGGPPYGGSCSYVCANNTTPTYVGSCGDSASVCIQH